MIRGSIDLLTSEQAIGWMYAASADGPLVAQAHLFGRIVGEAEACLYRADLFSAGMGDGNCGFDLRFYEPLRAQHLPMVAIRPQGGDVELPRTGATSFVEFFRSVHGLYPAAGRPPSVFGGLWTDRSDALRILSGRSVAGVAKPEVTAELRTLIEEGWVLLGGSARLTEAVVDALERISVGEATATGDGASEHDALGTLSEVILDGQTLSLLQAVLDDEPGLLKAAVRAGGEAAFAQPSTAVGLPSPAECLCVVFTADPQGVELDIVSGSHTLPEFTSDGRSRWVSRNATASVEIALAHGCSVETRRMEPGDLAIVGPGTIHRARPLGTGAAISAWIIRSTQPPFALFASEKEPGLIRPRSAARKVI